MDDDELAKETYHLMYVGQFCYQMVLNPIRLALGYDKNTSWSTIGKCLRSNPELAAMAHPYVNLRLFESCVQVKYDRTLLAHPNVDDPVPLFHYLDTTIPARSTTYRLLWSLLTERFPNHKWFKYTTRKPVAVSPFAEMLSIIYLREFLLRIIADKTTAGETLSHGLQRVWYLLSKRRQQLAHPDVKLEDIQESLSVVYGRNAIIGIPLAVFLGALLKEKSKTKITTLSLTEIS